MNFNRQLGIVTPAELPAVILIGCGGIGSPTAVIAAKMGVPEITLIDDDHVDEHNLPNQFYRHEDLTEPKVRALADIISKFSLTKCYPEIMRVTAESYLSGVVLSGVDSMAARIAIWDAVKRQKENIPIYIEGRMLRETFIINTVQPSIMSDEDVSWYESTMCPDSEAVDGPCTERAVAYNSFAIGSLIALQIKKFAKKEPLERQIIVDLTNLLLMK